MSRPIQTIVSTGLFVLACLAMSVTQAAGEARHSVLARRILESVGRPVGLAHLPRSGDGKLALALLEADDGMRLHAQDSDYSRVRAARKAADHAGVYGRRAWFDQGDLERLQPIARSVDLVVLTDLASAELTAELAAEIRRILHPWYGTAILGDTTGEMPAGELQTWAATIAEQIEQLEGTGTLLKLTADPLEGADNWPMWWKDPGNNCVSEDTVFQPPTSLQWTGKSFEGTRQILSIIDGGRVFTIWYGALLQPVPVSLFVDGEPVNAGSPEETANERKCPMLIARTVGSGTRLWHRVLSPEAMFQLARGIMVADGDQLLIADGDTLLVLDQASGQEVQRLKTNMGEIRWVAVSDDKILLLGGLNPDRDRKKKMSHLERTISYRMTGTSLTALDRKTLKTVWRIDRQTGKDAFDPRSPAIDNGRIFLCSEQDTAQAIDLKTGAVVWEREVGFERKERHTALAGLPLATCGFAFTGVYVFSAKETKYFVLSQEDGSTLWSREKNGRNNRKIMPFSVDGLVLGCDPLTGEEKQKGPGNAIRGAPCGRDTWAPFLRETSFDPAVRLKGPCGAGSFVANGLLWKMATDCICQEWRGFVVEAPREQAPRISKRLFATSPAAVPSKNEATGWLTRRANPSRSSSVPYAVPAEPAIAWQANDLQAGHYIWKGRNMEAEYAPVPAVIANGEVVVAHGDGSINAFDLETGKQHWRVHTSGRIQCGPTIWRDRAFVNSMDGHLYAFALADGRELWRLRVAPRTGRMMVYGQLGSRWPAIASPMVVGDQVVASAGLIGEIDGVHVVSANAETGEIIWERDEWSSSETRGRLSGLAQFTQMGDELLFRAAQMQPVRLAVANGACAPAMPRTLDELVGDRSRKELFKSVNAYKASSYGVLGHETGALSPNMLCYGGRRLLQDQREKDVRQQKIMVLCRDDTGEGRLPIVRIVGAGGGPVAFVCVFPVWGEEDIVFFGVPGETKRSESIVSIKKQELIEAIRQIAMETEVEDILAMGQTITGRGVSIPEKHLVRELSIADEELRRWQVPLLYDQTVAAAALARRTLVVALQLREKATLVALDRKDGNRLWELKLPARPVYNGIAIAPDGSIVLTLVDGRVVKVGEA